MLFFQRKWLFWNDFSKCFDRSLTTGVDTPAGTAGNDVFNGSDTTYTAQDTINGGAGADTFVAGSAIFGKPDYKAVIDQMRAALA